jgi:transposase
VFEIPVIKTKVTEFRTHEVECPDCHTIHKTEFPKEVTQPVQYGENIQALISYLTMYQFLPLERATEAISDIIHQIVSEGTLVNVNNRVHKNLEGSETSIKEQLKASGVVHFDETGMSCGGKRYWLHSASTKLLTHYAVHKKRGAKATNDIGILPELTGTAVHDHRMPYYTFQNCSHAECNAHNIRNLKGVYEDYKHKWAGDMANVIKLRIFDINHSAVL